jgi:hypothetical protein
MNLIRISEAIVGKIQMCRYIDCAVSDKQRFNAQVSRSTAPSQGNGTHNGFTCSLHQVQKINPEWSRLYLSICLFVGPPTRLILRHLFFSSYCSPLVLSSLLFFFLLLHSLPFMLSSSSSSSSYAYSSPSSACVCVCSQIQSFFVMFLFSYSFSSYLPPPVPFPLFLIILLSSFLSSSFSHSLPSRFSYKGPVRNNLCFRNRTWIHNTTPQGFLNGFERRAVQHISLTQLHVCNTHGKRGTERVHRCK